MSFISALSVNNRELQQHISSNNSSSSTRSPKRPPLPAALRTVTSPQRALQMPAFTSLQHLNLQQNPSSSPTMGYNPSDFHSVHSCNDTNNDNIPWICSVCTFQNHPLLNKCEQCEQPRNPSGTIQITAAHFEPRFENVHYQQQAHTNNHDTTNARSFCMTNTPKPNNDQQRVPQSAPVASCPFFDLFEIDKRTNSISEEADGDSLEHTYVNVSSRSVGHIPGIFQGQLQTKTEQDKKDFVKGHKYRPSM